MTWLPVGLALGLGILLSWNGFRVLRDESLDDGRRCKGLWMLSAVLVLAAVSMIAMGRLGGG